MLSPENQLELITEMMNQPPTTENFERVNFRNMNIFSKIRDLPNFKNKKVTEQIRQILIEQNDKPFRTVNKKLVDRIKEEIERDYWVSNYKYRSVKRKRDSGGTRKNTMLLNLHMKRKGRNLELVEEDYNENDTEFLTSP